MISKTVLITGAAGFIGAPLIRHLGQRGFRVKASSCDVSDFHALKLEVSSGQWDAVIHLAGLSNVQDCEADPTYSYQVNTLSIYHLAQVLADTQPSSHLIFPSSAQIYTGSENVLLRMPLNEESEIDPKSTYSKTKWAAEVLLRELSLRKKLKVTVLRLFNHTHHTQAPVFFLPSMLKQIRESVNGKILVGNLNVERDIGPIQDLLDAFLKTLEMTQQECFEVFNVCSGFPKRLSVLAANLAKRLSKDIEFVVEPGRIRQGEPVILWGTSEKFQAATGWRPSCQNEDALLDQFLAPLTS